MAKTGRAVAKLTEKAKRNATRAKHGTMVAVITRTKSTYAEKLVAFEAHKRAIHGFHRGHFHEEGGRNPLPRVTDLSKDGKKQGVVFRGDGLPDEVTRQAKTAAERAKEDKRQPIKSEMVSGWRPQRGKWRASDPVRAALSSIL